MSLYIGEDKNKSWEELCWSIERLPDTWSSARLLSFAIRFCEREDQDYVSWLAKCALHFAHNQPEKKEEVVKSLTDEQILDQFDKFSSLPTNWDGYGAEPPNEKALENARKVVAVLEAENFLPQQLAADADGGICIMFFREGKYADFSCDNEGGVLIVTKYLHAKDSKLFIDEINIKGISKATKILKAHLSE